MKKSKRVKKNDDRYGLAIPAGLLIGVGVGLLIGQVAAFTLIGLGVGFLIGFLIGRK